MTAILLISVVAFGISLLTLFSGSGLGTVLMPVFALFFPLPVAIAATAVIHLSNSIFKVILVGKKADWQPTATCRADRRNRFLAAGHNRGEFTGFRVYNGYL